jgi:septal ring factor EnvC (AmiA/AmiB activator)
MRKSNGLLIIAVALSLVAPLSPTSAQDIRGLEACMAEKAMERRTGCLQANIEFLQQELAKLKRETQAQLAAANRDFATAKTENAALKAALAKLEADVSQLKAKAEPAKK